MILSTDTPIDLQTHTVLSDGTWQPEQLVDHLAGEGFGLAAITDHDRADTAERMQALAREKAMPLLVAVEMTTIWRGEDITDILCYGFDPDKPALRDLAQDVVRRQQENTRQVYEYLLHEGYTFPRPAGEEQDEIEVILAKPSAQQPHELVALLKRHGYGTPEKSVGRILYDAGVTFATNEPAAVVDAAHRSGAVCLIAHPGRSDGFTCFDADLLDQFRSEIPIDGLEAYYPLHTPEQTEMYQEYARKHRLLVSSGSDSHGPDKQLPVKYRAELSRALLERLGIQFR
ncbi:MAG: PHP domain-containing protein [Anaerolineae bacterium]|nr:PHP domain-containing protein [Anaerolineae bacterium]